MNRKKVENKNRRLTMLAVGLFASIVSSWPAQAAKTYQFSGQVSGISRDSIALKRGSEVLEFRRDPIQSPPELKGVKVGDPLTVWYTLEAQRMKMQKGMLQQPGQAAPAKFPAKPTDGSGEKKGIIVDDRAFYDVHNESPADTKPAPSS